MKRPLGPTGGLLLFLLAVSCRSGPAEPSSALQPGGRSDNPHLFGPEAIEKILKTSPRTYRVSSGEAVEPVGVVDIVRRQEKGGSRRMDPFIEVDRSEGKVRLRSHLPDEDVEPLFSQASDAFAARDFERARRLYREAVDIRPGYFKSYTYLGNALYFLARYAEAQEVFEQALRLNPFDYQAHLFLGDTLHQLGHYDEAKRSLTHAFVLNRDNEVVQERLRGSLAKMGLALREARIEPKVRVLPSIGEEVVIQLDREEGERWYALAACLACWSYEEACRGRAPPDQDPLRIAMYRECLLNQAASVAARSED
ncbi:MAG: tetratricopeptide repeat protein, partial [Myxococcota bacterium]